MPNFSGKKEKKKRERGGEGENKIVKPEGKKYFPYE